MKKKISTISSFEKKTLYGAILAIIIGGVLIPGIIFAWEGGGGLEEDFNEDYTPGDLVPQNSWWHTGDCLYNDFQVESTTTYEGAYGLSYTSKYPGGGSCEVEHLVDEEATDGTQRIWLKVDDPTHSQNMLAVRCESGAPCLMTMCGIWSTGDPGFCCLEDGYVWGCTLDPEPQPDTWYQVIIQWRSADYRIRAEFRSADGELVTSREFDAYTTWPGSNSYSVSIYGFNWDSGYENSYFDFLTTEEEEPPFISGYEPILEPVNPSCFEFSTITSPISFTATGFILIPSGNPAIWNSFEIYADNYNDIYGGSVGYATSTGGLTAGEIGTYSVPLELDDGAWHFSYRLTGYDPTTFSIVSKTWVCDGGGIGTELPSPEIEMPGCVDFEPEDCSGYDLLERLVCDLKNFLGWIFIPSCGEVNELKRNMVFLQDKVPANYLVSVKNFLLTLQGDVSSSTDLVIGFWNSTSTIQINLFGNDFTNTIRNFLKIWIFVLAIGFLKNWGRQLLK
jgi:hypothetical protein